MDRFNEIQTGFRDSTAYPEWQKFKKMVGGWFPKKDEQPTGPVEANSGIPQKTLPNKIADLRRKVLSNDDSYLKKQIKAIPSFEDLSDEQLKSLYKKVFGDQEVPNYQMVSDLYKYQEEL